MMKKRIDIREIFESKRLRVSFKCSMRKMMCYIYGINKKI